MANPEHVAIVRKGAAAIEEWRRNNKDKILDLGGANLEGCELPRANLIGANLSNANLALSDLSRSNLASANLLDAILTHADLSDADLSNSNLHHANLKLVRLSHANLSGSILISAVFYLAQILRGTVNLKHAIMGSTAIVHCNMNVFEGLETVMHAGPSYIDTNTLIISYMAAGRRFTKEIESFFLNAGVPKKLLDSLPEILAATEYCNSFVCYGEPDKAFAERLVKDLRAMGAQCWIYSLDSTPGERVWGEITQRRREAEKMIVLCSAPSLIRDGVKKEIEEQIDEEPDKMIPVSLDNLWKEEGFTVKRGQHDLKPFLKDRNYADFCNPSEYDASLDRLLKGLKKSGKPSRKSKK
jgi:hypothetical protein